MPARVIETAEHYEPAMRGVQPPGGLWVGIAGLDLVRDPTASSVVLEDNLMTPSGFGYAAAARDAVAGSLDLAERRATTASCRSCCRRAARGAPPSEPTSWS